jgi:hypothetical protein
MSRMPGDLVKRLISTRCECNECWRERCEAADEVAQLRAAVAEEREACARVAETYPPGVPAVLNL